MDQSEAFNVLHPSARYMAHYLGANAAAKRLGVAPLTLRERIRRGEVPHCRHPLDARLVLLRTADVEQIARRAPRPATKCDN